MINEIEIWKAVHVLRLMRLGYNQPTACAAMEIPYNQWYSLMEKIPYLKKENYWVHWGKRERKRQKRIGWALLETEELTDDLVYIDRRF